MWQDEFFIAFDGKYAWCVQRGQDVGTGLGFLQLDDTTAGPHHSHIVWKEADLEAGEWRENPDVRCEVLIE